MQQPTSLRRVFVLSFSAATLIGTLPTVVNAAQGTTQVGTARYDNGRERLLVPVQGAVPTVRVNRLAAKQYIVDLPSSVMRDGEAQGQRLRSPALAGWSLSEEPNLRAVRLRMTLKTDVPPRLRYDRAAGGYVLQFTPDMAIVNAGQPRRATRTALLPVAKQVLADQPAAIARTAIVPTSRPNKAAKSTPVAGKPALSATRFSRETVKQGLAARSLPVVKASVLKPVTVATKAAPIAPLKVKTPVKIQHGPLVYAPVMPVVTRAVKKPVALKLAAVKPTHQVAHRPARHQTFLGEADAHIGVPTFDAKAGFLSVPYTGSLDQAKFDVVRLNSRWSYIDVPDSRPTFTGVKYQERADKLFQRWVMAKRPNRNTTRLSFALGSPASIAVKLEAKRFLVAVRPDSPLLGAQPSPFAIAKAPAAALEQVSKAPDTASVAQLAGELNASLPASEAASSLATAPVDQPVVAQTATQAANQVVATASKPAEVAVPTPTKPEIAVAPKPVRLAVSRKASLARALSLSGRSLPTAPETRLRRPYYDAERFGLVIPYEGRTPLFRWNDKSDMGAVIELRGDVVSEAHLQPETHRHGALGSWKLERNVGKGSLSVALAYAKPSELVVAADPDRKQLLLIPQPRLDDNRANTGPANVAIAGAGMSRDGSAIYLPFSGAVPRYTIDQVSPSFAYIDFEKAALAKNDGVQFYAPNYHPTLNYWMVTQPEGATTVRLAVALARPGTTAVYQDPATQRLVVVLGDSSPVVQATGNRTPRLPEPWPGASRPATEVSLVK